MVTVKQPITTASDECLGRGVSMCDVEPNQVFCLDLLAGARLLTDRQIAAATDLRPRSNSLFFQQGKAKQGKDRAKERGGGLPRVARALNEVA